MNQLKFKNLKTNITRHYTLFCLIIGGKMDPQISTNYNRFWFIRVKLLGSLYSNICFFGFQFVRHVLITNTLRLTFNRSTTFHFTYLLSLLTTGLTENITCIDKFLKKLVNRGRNQYYFFLSYYFQWTYIAQKEKITLPIKANIMGVKQVTIYMDKVI